MPDVLDNLRERFKLRCAADIEVLRAALDDPSELGGDAFETMIHRLAGFAGSIGFPDLSILAAEIDEIIARGERPDVARLQSLEVALGAAFGLPGAAPKNKNASDKNASA